MTTVPLPPSVRQQLQALAGGMRRLRLARAFALWLGGCGLSLAITLLVLSHLPLPLTVWPILVVALPALGLGALLWALARCLMLSPPLGSLAEMVEIRYPDLQDRLLALVDPAPACAPHCSVALAQAMAVQVAERLQAERLVSLVPWRLLRPVALAALAGVLTAAVMAATCPQGLARLLRPPELRASVATPTISRRPPQPTVLGLFDLSVQLNPPEYAGLEPRVLTAELERLKMIRGTRVTVRGRVSGGVRVALQLGSRPPLGLTPRNGRLEYSWVPRTDMTWELVVHKGQESEAVGPFRITLTPDAPPQVRIVEPGRDVTLSADYALRLTVSASDDFGLSSLALLYRRRGERSWHSQPLAVTGRDTTSTWVWDLGPMGLRPGDGVEFRAQAVDNNTVTGPGVTRTRVYTARVGGVQDRPTPTQVLQRSQERQQEALERLRGEAESFDEQLRALAAQASGAEARGSMPDIPRASLQEALERLRQRAQDMRQAVDDAEQALRNNPLISDELLRKVQELRHLISGILDKELRRVMEKLQQALQARTLKELRQAVETARDAQQRFLDKLEGTLSLFRRAKLEAELGVLMRLARQLAERQDRLGARVAQTPDGQRVESHVREQKELAQQAAPLTDQVSKVSKEAEAEGEAVAATLRRVATSLKQQDPSGQMRRAASALDRGRPKAARPDQEQAARALRAAAAGLASAAADLNRRERDALANASQQLAREAVTLSQAQERAREWTLTLVEEGLADQVVHKSSLATLRRAQEAAARGVAGLSERLRNLSGQTSLVDPQLAERANALAGLMQEAARRAEAGQLVQTLDAQTQAMRGLNELARDLMKLSSQVDQASAQMALQEYLRRLEALAEQQRALNQRAREAERAETTGRQERGAQGMPTPVPGAAALAQMAQEQALIRAALQQLLGDKGAGKLADQLGHVPAEMEKVEDELRGGHITAQTVRRQEDILHRMLDAQRSLYSKKQESAERKAEAPRAYRRPTAPPALRPDQSRPPRRTSERLRSLADHDLPLDFEAITREYLRRVR